MASKEFGTAARFGLTDNGPGKNPGTIWKNDAEAVNDIAKYLNSISVKFKKTDDLPSIPDINEKPLNSAPGENVGRGENKHKRELVFGSDDVKVASLMMKWALFDPNVDIGNRNPRHSALTTSSHDKTILDKEIDHHVALYDYAATPEPLDQRQYGTAPFRSVGGVTAAPGRPFSEQHPSIAGLIGNKKNPQLEEISNKYLVEQGLLKASTPIPSGNPLPEDEYNNPHDDINDTSQVALQNMKINRPPNRQVRIAPVKKGSFLLTGLLSRYELKQ